MSDKKIVTAALCAFLAAFTTSCNLLNTLDAEGVSGRGAQAFDPYGADSGAIKLALQMFKGCAILATGEPIQKGSAKIPYPSTCLHFGDTTNTPVAPTGRMQMLAGTSYFLSRLTMMDLAENLHTDFADPGAAAPWFGTSSDFKELDWKGLTILRDEITKKFNDETGAYIREVIYGNAAWQLDENFSFLVEVLDTDGTVRNMQVFRRADFLAETPETGHTRISWRVDNIGPPRMPGDNVARPTPGVGPPPRYVTNARIDFAQSTIPTRTIDIDRLLVGDGAIRVTWSLMPHKPLYFPVTFINEDQRPKTCFAPDGTMVACGFSLNPRAVLSMPANGEYYVPGETFDMRMLIEDGEGNALHQPDALPSYGQYLRGESNGLTYLNFGYSFRYLERDGLSGAKIAGPLQNFRYTQEGTINWFENTTEEPSVAESFAVLDILPGIREDPVRATTRVHLPADAEPGTYSVTVKAHRQFLGERISKANTFFFQVGQAEPTSYPNRIGNCQICHRGVLSLDNVHHGIAVDHVEGCKTCHSTRLVQKFHRIHMYSPKYPMAKNDCTVCHLTRESAVRPSVDACSSCHPDVHGDEYFNMRFTESGDGPSRYSNCAQSCHVNTTPNNHLLPQ